MKIEGNGKCHACPRPLVSVVFRYSGIPLLFRSVPAIPLVFRVSLFRVPLFRHCSVVPCSGVPSFIVYRYTCFVYLCLVARNNSKNCYDNNNNNNNSNNNSNNNNDNNSNNNNNIYLFNVEYKQIAKEKNFYIDIKLGLYPM